jgi:hypothetical protein
MIEKTSKDKNALITHISLSIYLRPHIRSRKNKQRCAARIPPPSILPCRLWRPLSSPPLLSVLPSDVCPRRPPSSPSSDVPPSIGVSALGHSTTGVLQAIGLSIVGGAGALGLRAAGERQGHGCHHSHILSSVYNLICSDMMVGCIFFCLDTYFIKRKRSTTQTYK